MLRGALKKGFWDRAAELGDMEEIKKVFNSYWEPLLGMPKFTLDDIHNGFTAPGFDIESSTRVVLSPGGQIVGCILVIDYFSPPVHPIVQGCVHPDYEGKGVGMYLLKWAEQRAHQAVKRVPDGIRVAMNLTALNTHKPTLKLFKKMKLQAVRHSFIMVAQVDEKREAAEFPNGIVIQTYRDFPDLEAIYRAADEAFQDHWGYVPGNEEEGIQQWKYQNENNPDFDPSLWFLAMDGNEIAGIALCSPSTGTDQEMGFITLFGVRRPWRRRGLALALLVHVFNEFRQRERKWVGLGVDADSLTGAFRVYEKAGMKIVRDIVTYEKELRPGIEMGKQTAGS